jgi:hypothetical protein
MQLSGANFLTINVRGYQWRRENRIRSTRGEPTNTGSAHTGPTDIAAVGVRSALAAPQREGVRVRAGLPDPRPNNHARLTGVMWGCVHLFVRSRHACP